MPRARRVWGRIGLADFSVSLSLPHLASPAARFARFARCIALRNPSRSSQGNLHRRPTSLRRIGSQRPLGDRPPQGRRQTRGPRRRPRRCPETTTTCSRCRRHRQLAHHSTEPRQYPRGDRALPEPKQPGRGHRDPRRHRPARPRPRRNLQGL